MGETPTRPHVLGGDPIPELPDLRLLRCIGKGAYGAVWLAENRTTGKLLAVKVIPRKAVGPGDRVGRELKALIHFEAGLGSPHENVLTVHHVGQTDDFLFYTMDPADNVGGGAASTEPGYRPATLAARLEGSALPPHECLALARQLLAGLAHLHAAGLAHRDVKPSNCVFVGGKLKVADVGLVTPSDATASAIGTPMYMPPDGRMDARADVYAAGLTVYEMLTGLPAHQFPRWPAGAVRALWRTEARALNRLVLRACQRDAERRFKDAREMLAALDALLGGRRPRVGRRLALTALAAAALLALAAILAPSLWRSGRPRSVDSPPAPKPSAEESCPYREERRADLPAGMAQFACSTPIDGTIYVFGGQVGKWDAISDGILAYDIAADSWRPARGRMPYPYVCMGNVTAACNGKVYISPGIGPAWNNGWGTHRRVIEFDPATETATERASFGAVVWGVSPVTVGNAIYWFGAHGPGQERRVWRHDPAADSLAPASTLAGPGRALAALLGADGRIYAFGGGAAHTQFREIDVFDPGSNTCSLHAARLPEPKSVIAWPGRGSLLCVAGIPPERSLWTFDTARGAFADVRSVYTLDRAWASASHTYDRATGNVYLMGGAGPGDPPSLLKRVGVLVPK